VAGSERQRLLALAFASADLLVEVDRRGRIGFAVGATRGLVPVSGDVQLPGRSLFDLFHPQDAPVVEALLSSLRPGSRRGPLLVRTGETGPDRAPVHASLCAFRPDGRSPIAIALARASAAAAVAVPERPRDAETALLTEDGFQEQAAEMLRAAETAGRPMELMLLELPGLEAVTGGLSREKSAELNARLGAILRSVSADGRSAGRIGPNRFGVIHDKGIDAADVERRIAALPAQVTPGAAPMAVTRAAVDMIPVGQGVEDGVRALRYALNRFAALPAGAAPPATLADALEGLVQDAVDRIRDLDAIVAESRFDLVFQPIVSLADGAVHHYEVLARFKGGGGPGEVIQFAEEIGMIERLDLAIAKKAIDRLRASPPSIALAVNVSGRSIENTVFLRVFLEMLEANRDLAPRLKIELTESAELKRLDEVDKVVQRLRGDGFKVCLDDFGAGAASFQYLQALRVDVVKIDGAYVKRIGQSKRDEVMLGGLVRLCDELGIQTVAEFVETKAQADVLRAMGVGLGQGWLFGKPLADLPG